MATILITGASRGLGLEFAKQYGLDGWKVIATCRDPGRATELKGLAGDIDIYSMDIEKSNQIEAVAAYLEGTCIDMLINNAGIAGPRDDTASFGNINSDTWLDMTRTNTISPLKVTEAFVDHIKQSDGRLIVFISSRAASITERGALAHHQRGGNYAYRSCKAALNAAAKSLAFDLAPIGISVLVLHPGWVNSGAGDSEAQMDAETSVSCMRGVISEFSASDTGSFRNYDGEVIPW